MRKPIKPEIVKKYSFTLYDSGCTIKELIDAVSVRGMTLDARVSFMGGFITVSQAITRSGEKHKELMEKYEKDLEAYRVQSIYNINKEVEDELNGEQ